MTEEQIRQNAEEYASKFAPTKHHKTGIPLAINHTAMVSFIEGAHSRDEEIASLLSQLEDKDGYIAHLRKELSKLRNPWISVEERLPPDDGNYLVHVRIDGFSARIIFAFAKDGKFIHLPNTYHVTHWMLIPQIEKGE